MNIDGTTIEDLWMEHLKARFPAHLRGKDLNGIDFVMLDADIAGCVSTFLERGILDSKRLAVLGLCYRNVRFVLPVLNEEGSAYYWRLERLSELVLKKIARS